MVVRIFSTSDSSLTVGSEGFSAYISRELGELCECCTDMMAKVTNVY